MFVGATIMTNPTSTSQPNFTLNKNNMPDSYQPMQVYHLSHDLRGPLNSILGFAELLLEGIEGPLTENQHADLTAIYQSAQNLLYLINTVVDLSKLESERLILEIVDLDLSNLLNEVAAIDFGAIKPDDLTVSVESLEAIPPVRADRERVIQIFDNLLRFIFKFKKKGTIKLSAHSNGQEVTAQVDVDEFELAEVGSPELFELVIKIEPAGRTKFGKGGLELPLARGLAEKQQGQLWLEHNEGNGITFYLKLPVALVQSYVAKE
jgi:signal transduction histidine kinase